jgi:hypothetical protein
MISPEAGIPEAAGRKYFPVYFILRMGGGAIRLFWGLEREISPVFDGLVRRIT